MNDPSSKPTSRYIFSGNLTDKMVEYLKKVPSFQPIDVLVSQLDRPSINKMLNYLNQGVVKSLFIDSGAYSVYTGKKDKIDVDEYISYVDSLDDYIYAVAQVDTLPGKFGQPKYSQDYIESADKSWENYLYMRSKMKSPEKLIPVFHFGEPFSALTRMLDYRDPDPRQKSDDVNPYGEQAPHPHMKWSEVLGWTYTDRVGICGLSPANDSGQPVKNKYLDECYTLIEKSSYPDIKTHLFGMTSLDALSRIPYYSADSVSHRLRSAYNKVFTRKWGTISLSDGSRTSRVRSNMSFIRTCDEKTRKEVLGLFAYYGFTWEQMRDDNAARTAVDICETQQAVLNEYAYHPSRRKKVKKIFDL